MKPKLAQERLVYDTDLSSGELTLERRTVLERVPAGARVLEIGGNTGYFAELLRKRGCHITTVEIDPRAAAVATGRSNEVITGDVEDPEVFGRISGRYDVILLMHVLEHMVDPWRILRQLRSKLEPAGRILVLIPNVASWGVRKELFFRGTFEYEDVGILDRTHVRFFTLDSGRRLIEDSGYEVQAWRPTSFCVPLQRRLSLIPLIGRVHRHWERWLSGRYPNLCGEILFFEATALRE